MKKVIVIGASNIDRLGTVDTVYTANDSNPGKVETNVGGVGCNIAHNLGILGLKPTFITGLGDDQAGNYIHSTLNDARVLVDAVTLEKTPEYLAIFDDENKLVGAINAMAPFNDFYIPESTSLASTYTIIDLNINDVTLKQVIDSKNVLCVDGTSAHKIEKIKPYLKAIDYLKLNDIEAQKITNMPIDTLDEMLLCAKTIRDLGVKTVLLTIGAKGLIVADHNGVTHYPALKGNIINTSGAGDAFLAGYVFGLIHEINPIKTALTVALMTCEYKDSVNPHIKKQAVLKRMEAIK